MPTSSKADLMSQVEVSPEQFGVYAQKVNTLEASVATLARSVEMGFSNVRSENKSQVEALAMSISNLSSKFDERSRPQYMTFIGLASLAIAVIGGLGGFVYSPLKSGIDAAETKIDNLAVRSVNREDLDNRLKTASDRRDDWQRQSEKRDDLTAIAIDKLKDAVVPRAENAEHWIGTAREIANLQRQIDDNRQQFGSTFSLRDAFQQLQKEVDDLKRAKNG